MSPLLTLMRTINSSSWRSSLRSKRKNKAVGIVLHELPLAFKFCDRLLLMKNGQIMQSGTPEELLKTGLIEHLFGVSLIPVMLDKEVEYIERKIHR